MIDKSITVSMIETAHREYVEMVNTYSLSPTDDNFSNVECSWVNYHSLLKRSGTISVNDLNLNFK